MDGFLNFRIEILNTKRGAVETNFMQGSDMVAGKATGIDFDASFDVFRKSEMAMDDFSQAPDFVWRKERRRTAAPVELHDFAARIEQRAHLGHLFFEIVYIS